MVSILTRGTACVVALLSIAAAALSMVRRRVPLGAAKLHGSSGSIATARAA
jgi:hypothetical protein